MTMGKTTKPNKLCYCGHEKANHNYKPDYTNTACIFMSCPCMEYVDQ